MQKFLDSQDVLETIVAETEQNIAHARKLVEGLSDEQMNWKPAPEKWSIAQCLDHLAVTSKQFDDYFPAAITRGRAKWPVTEAIPYRPSWLGGWLIRQVIPSPKSRRVPAPKIFHPASSKIEGALEKFIAQHQRVIEFVRSAKGLDYNKTRLRSPVTALVRYSLADAFIVTVAHSWRHLAQAERVREMDGFPAH